MSSASAKFVPILPTGTFHMELTHWGTSVPRPLFCGVEKILKLYYDLRRDL